MIDAKQEAKMIGDQFEKLKAQLLSEAQALTLAHPNDELIVTEFLREAVDELDALHLRYQSRLLLAALGISE